MIKRLSLTLSTALILTLLLGSCTLSHRFAPQSDIGAREVNQPSMDERVLVASRSSEFKNALVARIEEAYADRTVYVKLIGLSELEGEDASQYAAVVLINTCMFWELDPDVKAFLDRHENHANMIVITTAGNPEWEAEREGRDFDAISSASQMSEVEDLSGQVVEMIGRLLEVE